MHDLTKRRDYSNPKEVEEWAENANARRPFRLQFFEAFAAEIAALSQPTILELGSGPGFLAEHLLQRCAIRAYHLFDFSPYMLRLSRTRLLPFGETVFFHQRSFSDEQWWQGLPVPFDAVLSLQALHQVRQAERLKRLYQEIRCVVKTGGLVLVADKISKARQANEGLLTASAQEAALRAAGLQEIRPVLARGDLMMFASYG